MLLPIIGFPEELFFGVLFLFITPFLFGYNKPLSEQIPNEILPPFTTSLLLPFVVIKIINN
jgi:hypothetical protein